MSLTGDQLRMRRMRLDDLELMQPPDGFEVGRHRPGDDEAWVELLNRNDELRQPGDDGQLEQWREPPWRRKGVDIPLDTVHFVRRAGTVVATACGIRHATGVTWELGWVAADPAVRGRGLGRLVCVATLRYLHERLGAAEAFLRTDDERLPAIGLYLKLGFVPDPSGPEQQRFGIECHLAGVRSSIRPGDAWDSATIAPVCTSITCSIVSVRA
jgi:RimJ/RimL family protein N-acetyltransferase